MDNDDDLLFLSPTEEDIWKLVKKHYIEELSCLPIFYDDDNRILIVQQNNNYFIRAFISTKTHPIYVTPTNQYVKQLIESLKNLGRQHNCNNPDIMIFMPKPSYRFSLSELKELPKDVKYSDPNPLRYDYEKDQWVLGWWNLESYISNHRDTLKRKTLDYYDEEDSIMRNLQNGSGDLHGL